jgi:energy-coupling factor transporter ATP-binding protein EcfA2
VSSLLDQAEDPRAPVSHASPTEFQADQHDVELDSLQHLQALKTLCPDAEIRFAADDDLLPRLLLSDFGAMVHQSRQASLVSTDQLIQQLELAPCATALRRWPRTIGHAAHSLDRAELTLIVDRVISNESSVTLLTGAPGSGKSALLAQLASCMEPDYQIVAIKADELPNTVTDQALLAAELRLPGGTDAVTSIQRLAGIGPTLVLLDQLDALARLIVHTPARLTVLVELFDRLAGTDNVHIVASCRSFERLHDPTLRRIDAEVVELELPEWSAVSKLLEALGIDADDWNAELKESLRSPHALSLFVELLERDPQAGALLNYQQMLDRLWEQCIERPTDGSAPADVNSALQAVVDQMEQREQLMIPSLCLDSHARQRSYLISCGFLIQSGSRLGFRHQTYYEHALVRGFARDPQRLLRTIRERQHQLRARPQIWHGLNYLREVDDSSYDGVLNALWSDVELRPHLRMMLLEFVGQQSAPRAAEQECLAAALDNPRWFTRAMTALVGNPAWFDWLCIERLPRTMQGEGRAQPSATAILAAALPFAQSQVLALVRTHWLPRTELDSWSWRLMERVKQWDEQSVELVQTLVERGNQPGNIVSMLADVMRQQHPVAAVDLIAGWLHRQTQLASDEEDLRRQARSLLSHSELHAIDAIATSAPAHFCHRIWPWFLRAIASSSREYGSACLIGYRTEAFGMFLELDPEHRAQSGVAHGLDTALQSWARLSPAECLSFAEDNFGVDNEIAQRLIARALVHISASAPDRVLRYLAGDDRRLMLGEDYKNYGDSWALIAALSPHLDAARLELLVTTVKRWSPYRPGLDEREPDQAAQRDLWRRADRLRLLKAVPESYRTAQLAQLIEEERRVVPDEPPEPRVRRLDPILSPIGLASMQNLSDAEVVEALLGYPRKSADGIRGAYIEISRELGSLAKQDPNRAIALIDQLLSRAPTPTDYANRAGAVLVEVSQGEDSACTIAFATRLLDAGLDTHVDFRQDFAYSVCNILRKERTVPDRFLRALESWLAPDTQAAREHASRQVSVRDRDDSVLGERSRSITLPSGGNYPFLRALSAACLMPQPVQADRWLDILEAHVERIDSPDVWIALVAELQHLDHADPVRAAAFLSRLLEQQPRVIDRDLGAAIFIKALGWCTEAKALEWIGAFASAEDRRTQQAAAELLTLRHYWFPEDQQISASLDDALEDPISLAPDADRVRIGIAHTAAYFWQFAKHRFGAHLHWVRLATAQSSAHHEALMEIFDTRKHLPLSRDQQTREVLIALRDHPRLMRNRQCEDLARQLVQLAQQRWETELLGTVAIGLVDQFGADLDSQGSYAYYALEPMNDLVMLLQQDQRSQVRDMGTNLLEKLLEHGAGFVKDLLMDLDKRM